MSTRTAPEFEDEPPTAVRNMREVLRVYEKNAKQGLKKLSETWRKKTASSPPSASAPEEGAEAVASEEPPDDDEKKEPAKKVP